VRSFGCYGRGFVLLSALLCESACNQPAADPAKTAASGDGKYDREKVLNLASWADYIAPDTAPNFQRETGIKINYETYDSNEVLESKLMTGHTNYDVVIPTAAFFERQRKAGVYRKLDKSALPNLVNADPEVMRLMAREDPGNLYAVPYMYSITGLGYNIDKLHAKLGAEPPDGWGVVFDPAKAAKLKDCGIAIVDSPVDVFDAVLFYLGRDPGRFDPADLMAASEVLRKIRPFVLYIDATQHISDLANGSICVSLSWSGDVGQSRHRAIESNTGANVAFFVPREGSLITLDMMAIPADAPHPRNAALWLNYLLRPEVIAGITNFIHYPNGNSASLPLVAADIQNDRSIYPDDTTRKRLVSERTGPPDYVRLVTREWTRFRTGY
jgi:putrescine transport system substrate-binding protein